MLAREREVLMKDSRSHKRPMTVATVEQVTWMLTRARSFELELGVFSAISRQSQAWQHSLLAQEYYFGYHIFNTLGID